MAYQSEDLTGWDYVPELGRKASPELLRQVAEALGRDYACRAAYGKALLDAGVEATLKGIHFSDTTQCEGHSVAVWEGPAEGAPGTICWACKYQDSMAGVQPEAEICPIDPEAKRDLRPDMAEAHIQSDYDAKIAERMGR